MDDKDLQIENGSYTKVANRILEELVKIPLLGAELSICLFVIRKTYGFNKKEDQISLSQFQEGVKRSRPTVVKALKNLRLVNILKLVKVGSSISQKSLWSFNKYYRTWQLVKPPELVKEMTPTGKEKLKKLVKTPKHTKENTKDKQKKGEKKSPTPKERASFFFKGITDFIQKVNSPEAEQLKELLTLASAEYGVDTLQKKKSFWEEIVAFGDYWQERDQLGKRERWQLQKTFEVEKRLRTWFRNKHEWSRKSNTNSTKKPNYVL